MAAARGLFVAAKPSPLPRIYLALLRPRIATSVPSLRRPYSDPPGPPNRRGQIYDYDPKLGDPWYHHRLRTAEPLIAQSRLGRVARSPATKTVVAISMLAAVLFYFYNIETVPISGRRRFNCYTEKSVNEISDWQYKRILYDLEHQGMRFLPEFDRRTIMVKRVMRRLIPVSGMADQDWVVHVIDDPKTANAFVLPGGKVFVHSGIIPLARNESGLAAVLGHEIAHNLANHIGERMSASIGTNILLYSILLLSWATPVGLFATSFFLGGALDVAFGRPMGRLQESEADHLGLMMMAEACYDPNEAVRFWGRMDKAQPLQPPEWLSTHPSVCCLSV